MARQVRVEYEGALCHVMARGNQGQSIVVDDLDRLVWLETLAEGCEKTGWKYHADVLVVNHHHLLLEMRWRGVILHRLKKHLVKALKNDNGGQSRQSDEKIPVFTA